MMAVLLVLYETKDDENRKKMMHALKARHPNSIELTKTACAVHTRLLPVRIFDQLKEYLRSDDRLYVIPLSQPYVGYGPRETTQWLSDYLAA
ncbi:MAG: hypothetical protein ACJ8LN_04200 [Sulfurifustis sp.]